MSLLIVTSRYLKSGTAKTKSQRKNYTKYIATRESVEVREQSKKYSTENQKKLLNELLNDFPESKKYLEFEDYKNNPTAENASELISIIIERNADVIGNRQNTWRCDPAWKSVANMDFLMKAMSRLCLIRLQRKLRIIPEMCGRTLSHYAVKMRFGWVMTTLTDGVSLSCGILLTLQSRQKFRCAI